MTDHDTYSGELVPVNGQPSRDVERRAVWRDQPDNLDVVDGWIAHFEDVVKMAELIAPTEFVPRPIRNSVPAVAAAIFTGRELGIGPMAAMKHIQIIQGVPTLSAEYKRARVLAAGHEFRIVEWDGQHCKIEARRRGESKPTVIEYKFEYAQRANLVRNNGPYQTMPRRMMLARATTDTTDAMFPDVTNGLPTTELVEAGDFSEEFAGYREDPARPEEREKAGRTRQRKTPAHPEPNPGPEPEPPAAGPAVDVAGPEPEPAPEPEPEPKAKPKAKRNARDAIMRSFRDAGLDGDDKAAHRHSAMSAIVGHEVTSADDLTEDEQSTVADTLAECIAVAKARVDEIPAGHRKRDDLQRAAFEVIRELVTASRQTEARPEVEDPPFPEDFPDTPLPTSDPG
jgi:hypothetical protein